MPILSQMRKMCEEAGFAETANIEKIARAKNMMFGLNEWHRCPCDGNNPERSCISARCKQDIEANGECHCHCYKKKAG